MHQEPPNSLAEAALSSLREHLDQVMKATTAALDQAVSLAQAGERQLAMQAVLNLIDTLHAAERLSESYERLLVTGRASTPNDPFSSVN